MGQTFLEKKERHRRNQAVYEAIAKLRGGESVVVHGRLFHPLGTCPNYQRYGGPDGYVFVAIYKSRNRIRIGELCCKDALPNPKAYGSHDGPRHIRARNIYGWAEPTIIPETGGE